MLNPGDFILFFLSSILAVISLLGNGWTMNGIGPALLSIAGGFWQLWMQWLRHRSWLRHRDSGFAPSTQHLAISAGLGWALATCSAMVWTIMTAKGLQP